MSLYGIMRTSTSGMSAQASRLAAVADNIANSNTNGYKRASTEFASLLIETGPSLAEYTSGAVTIHNRHAVSEQGSLQNTSSATDLAIKGNGFFVVAGAAGTYYLTRAGSFVKNESGELVNAAGFKLLGYKLGGGQPTISVNGFSDLESIKIGELALTAKGSTTGQFTANLPSNDAVVAAASLPSANSATSAYNGKSSLVTYDNLGNQVLLDVYFSKSSSNTWEVTAYDKSTATANGFPYSSGPLTTATLNFDGTTGALTPASSNSITVAIPNGQNVTIDLSKTSQLATSYTVTSATIDGNPPSGVDSFEIVSDGTLMAAYKNGTRVPVYRIPLATVTSPDQLRTSSGNVFSVTSASGDIRIGNAETSNFGSINASTLEQSNVDLATELTTMIDSQRGYSANSKVFQTGSELMDVLINLKR
jgi:flagellar hook protein FlgE